MEYLVPVVIFTAIVGIIVISRKVGMVREFLERLKL